MSKLSKTTANQGFTLVELSIVIIIIGFLIAGIASGTSLIKSAELNSVITDFRNYQTSYNNFVSRYAQAPGDFQKAENIWPAAATGSTTACAVTGTSCMGDGNGKIDTALEVKAAWRELALAGMINASIAQVTTADAGNPGVNTPTSKVLGAGYSFVNGDPAINGLGIGAAAAGTALWPAGSSTNVILIGKAGTGIVNTINTEILNGAVYKAEDVYSIDSKIDDGNPVTGTVRAAVGSTAVTSATDCITSTPDYNLSVTSISCIAAMAVN